VSHYISLGEPELTDCVACRSGTNIHKETKQLPHCDLYSRGGVSVEILFLVKNPARLFPGLNKFEK
jgi:hypothetical protein